MNIDQIKALIGDLVLQNAVLAQEVAELKAKLAALQPKPDAGEAKEKE